MNNKNIIFIDNGSLLNDLNKVFIFLKILLKLHFRQPFYNIYRLHTHIDNTQQQIQYITRLVMFFCPIVWIIGNTASFMGGYSIAFHYPLDSRFAINHILISLFGNVLNSYLTIVNNRVFLSFFRETHFLYSVI